MINKNNTSTITSPQESWASTISDYIIKRRQQTYKAFVKQDSNQTQQGAITNTDDLEDWLFKSLLIALVKQLEEGHTVLIFKASDQEAPLHGTIAKCSVCLYQWQRNLLDILAGPLFDVIDSKVVNKEEEGSGTMLSTSIFELLDTILTHGTQLWLQSSLSSSDKAQLVERFHLIKHNFELMQHLNLENETLLSAADSLKRYGDKLSSHPLFTYHNFENSLSDSKYKSNSKTSYPKNSYAKQTPLIFQSQQQLSVNHSVVDSVNDSNKCNEYSLVFWLHRTWQAEYNLAEKIINILNQPITALPIKTPDNLNAQQIHAVQIANENAFSIITGGPGTGKTYTVAQLVIALQQAQKSQEAQSEGHQPIKFSTDSARLALAAPTGKAAQRMQESLQAALNHAEVEVQLQEAKTIHRLLGIGRDGRPRYHEKNPLGEDIIIIDEASMLGVELANHLVSAVKPGARLILLGDANQLAAVDAGAVLADLCHIPKLQSIHAQLTESRRFDSESGIGKLAFQINNKNTDIKKVWQLLGQDKSLGFVSVNAYDTQSPADIKIPTQEVSDNVKQNSLSNKKLLSKLTLHYSTYLNKIQNLLDSTIPKSVPLQISLILYELMEEFNKFRVLTAGHHGEWGDDNINAYLTNWHITSLKIPLGKSPWYHGRPVMIMQNNYELGLFNGDIGICLMTEDESSRLEVFFENKSQGIAVNLLNEALVSTAYAMTIHKSQGSEFDHVAITFDSSHSRLLSKELIYTAVTRAKKQVTIYSTKKAFDKAVLTPTERYTGLSLQFL
ncbi:exodeoxyribonuclease V subunit alpha [Psychrobacter sp.]|uniref:exodeoxyribonuclease V subunit alpha n=1 Tax=Psychrobacter sp. TaxID=56811 RepID=UPI0025D8DA89|nr:exodeoxyribonuclease V subunit alpha [Psychrobacter sp.]